MVNDFLGDRPNTWLLLRLKRLRQQLNGSCDVGCRPDGRDALISPGAKCSSLSSAFIRLHCFLLSSRGIVQRREDGVAVSVFKNFFISRVRRNYQALP